MVGWSFESLLLLLLLKLASTTWTWSGECVVSLVTDVAADGSCDSGKSTAHKLSKPQYQLELLTALTLRDNRAWGKLGRGE